jgi:hypothetical protein
MKFFAGLCLAAAMAMLDSLGAVPPLFLCVLPPEPDRVWVAQPADDCASRCAR